MKDPISASHRQLFPPWLLGALMLAAFGSAALLPRVSARTEGPPRLRTPAGPTEAARPVFRWSQVQGAADYTLEVEDAAGVARVERVVAAGACRSGRCQLRFPKPFANGAYAWRLRASAGPWSEPRSFTVAAFGWVSAGDGFSLVAARDGRVRPTGHQTPGSPGVGTPEDWRTRVSAAGLDDVLRVAAGSAFGVALRGDQTVWTWGSGAFGQLGRGGFGDSGVPRRVPGLTGVVTIAAGAGHALALLEDGTLRAWGSNNLHQLGDGTTQDRPSPIAVPGLDQVVAIAAGSTHSLAVRADGSLWAWGANDRGQLGDGSYVDRGLPTQVAVPPGVVAVFSGSQADHSFVLTSEGRVWGWGRNDHGQLGDGTTSDAPRPVAVQSLTDVVALAAGAGHTLAVSAGGSVFAWGANESRQLGDATPHDRPVPQPVTDLTEIVRVAAGASHSVALTRSGAVLSWGGEATRPTAGGDGASSGAVEDVSEFASGPLVPTSGAVVSPPQPPAQPDRTPTLYVTGEGGAVTGGDSHSLLLKPDGSVWTWGANGNGQLGDGTQTQRKVPTLISSLTGVAAIAAGASYSLALRSDGTLRAWGANSYGQLGDGTQTQRTSPVTVSGLSGVVAIAAGSEHALALKSDGSLWAWGRNDKGQLGDGTQTMRKTPVQVSGLTGVVAIAAGLRHSLALKSDGTLWSWGLNGNGQLGDNSTTDRTTPVQVANLSGVTAVAAGRYFSVALESDGSAWSWGQNGVGRLGDGTTTQRTTPVQVVDLDQVTAIVAGGDHTLALRADQSVWSWGYNASGQLGDGTTSNRTTAVQVQGLAGIVRLGAGGSHSLAITADGAVWSFGSNTSAQLGDGTAASSTVPVQICEDAFLVKTGTPVLSPTGGTFYNTVNVTLTTATPSATIRYTTDGSEPTEVSSLYGGPVAITATTTLKAKAFGAQTAPSHTASGSFTLKVTGVSLSPGTGTYATPQNVQVSCATSGAVIHYTTDGAEPSEADPVIASGSTLPVTVSQVLKAAAWKTGWEPSATASGGYVLKVGAPALTPGSGSYAGAQTVTVTTETPAASLHYTTGGQEPTLVDPSVTSGGTLSIDAAVTLKVKGWRDGWTASDTTIGLYDVSLGQAAVPAFDPAAGAYATPVAVRLSTATPGATIRYTLDGSEPGLGSPVYGSVLTITTTTTVKARAYRADYSPSATAAASYTVTTPVAAPVFSVAGGVYATQRHVTVTTATSGATIHYTLSGLDPTESDPTIASGGELAVDHAAILKARAFADGLEPSPVSRADYVVTGALAARSSHSLGLDSLGRVWAWGSGSEIGDGVTGSRTTPSLIAGLPEIAAIATGAGHTLALTPDGRIWAWGANANGQLGDGTTTPRTTPVLLASPTGVVAIAAGDQHSLAITGDGRAWAWGKNTYGQVGDGTSNNNRLTPTLVSLPPGEVFVAVAGGGSHSLAATREGAVYAWGANSFGQLGNGSQGQQVTPVLLPAVSGVGRLFAAASYSLQLRAGGGSAGSLMSHGYNSSGNLGDGTLEHRKSPVTVLDAVSSAAAGDGHVLAVDRGSRLWSWGWNPYGGLGDGSTSSALVPARRALDEVVAVAAGYAYSLALRADGRLWGWGSNSSGVLAMTGSGPSLPAQAGEFRLADNDWLLADDDGDGLSNASEYRLGTDPLDPDSNDDGVSDGATAGWGDPSSADTDGDGLTNLQEALLGTDPLQPDTDGDGVADGADCFPLDPTRTACLVADPGDETPPVITILAPSGAVPLP